MAMCRYISSKSTSHFVQDVLCCTSQIQHYATKEKRTAITSAIIAVIIIITWSFWCPIFTVDLVCVQSKLK